VLPTWNYAQMLHSLENVIEYLSCPDDKGSLTCSGTAMACTRCGRAYRVTDEGILDLLPREPAVPHANQQYAQEYQRQFHRPLETGDAARAWGTPDKFSPTWMLKRERQQKAVLSILRGSANRLKEQVLCDVSAGSGDYTLSYAPHFKWVFHCDLSGDSLHYAVQRARRMQVSNVIFLHVDYFALPFCRSLDWVICFDTLIRGWDHETALLMQIRRALSEHGKALVDFHNWRHNPLRRLGLLRQNFGQNCSYTRHTAEELLRHVGIEEWRMERFCQEFDPTSRWYKGLSSLVPAARLIYEFGGGRSVFHGEKVSGCLR
jgi:SAM-dependent methyltransferase